MNKHREILNKILADLIANLELDQVEQLQKTIIEMTVANNAKVTKAFVKFESEMPSETCDKIDLGSAELPFKKADRNLARVYAESLVNEELRKAIRTAQFVNINGAFGKFGNRITDRISTGSEFKTSFTVRGLRAEINATKGK